MPDQILIRPFFIMNVQKLFIAKCVDIDFVTKQSLTIIYRIPVTLLSDQFQKEIEANKFPNNITFDTISHASREACSKKTNALVFDFFLNPKGQIAICDMGRLEFTKRFCTTPATYLKKLENQYLGNAVNYTDEGKSSFQSNVIKTHNSFMVGIDQFDSILNDKAVQETCCKFERVESIKEKFSSALSDFLGQNPILPQEKIFTALRSIAFMKVADEEELERFFLVIDQIEFMMRRSDNLEELSKFIKSVAFQKEVLKKAVAVLDQCAVMIDLHKKDAYYLENTKIFLDRVLNTPLQEHVKCTCSIMDSKKIARENLSLRTLQLLSQFKFPEITQDLKEIHQAFTAENWVLANSLLCKIMSSPFFIQATSQSRFENQGQFLQYKCAAGIISLVDFFTAVVSNSTEYRWINFDALRAALHFLQNTTAQLEKGQLTPLKNWVKEQEDLPYAFQRFFHALKSFSDFSAQFKEESGKQFETWLLGIQNGRLDGNLFKELCLKISSAVQRANVDVHAISHEVHEVQSEMILLKKAAPIEPAVLKEQLELLNKKISDVCFPLLSFLHNFNSIIASHSLPHPVDAFALFETDPAKLLQFSNWEEKEEAEPLTIEREPAAEDPLEKELDQLFQEKNRRKILMNLNDFFKARALVVNIVSGKGSHLKLYLGERPIIIPHSKEIKVGTAGGIKKEILESLKQIV